MKKYFLLVLLFGCGSNQIDSYSPSNEIVEHCQIENQKCFMENHFNLGFCDKDLICYDCGDLKLGEQISSTWKDNDGKNWCFWMKCVSHENQNFAGLRYLADEGNCK